MSEDVDLHFQDVGTIVGRSLKQVGTIAGQNSPIFGAPGMVVQPFVGRLSDGARDEHGCLQVGNWSWDRYMDEIHFASAHKIV